MACTMTKPILAPDHCTSLDDVRRAIDHLDREVVALLGQRFQYVQAATRFKRTSEEAHAADRVRAVLNQRREWAEAEGLEPGLIEEMYANLIAYFVHAEVEMLEGRHNE